MRSTCHDFPLWKQSEPVFAELSGSSAAFLIIGAVEPAVLHKNMPWNFGHVESLMMIQAPDDCLCIVFVGAEHLASRCDAYQNVRPCHTAQIRFTYTFTLRDFLQR